MLVRFISHITFITSLSFSGTYIDSPVHYRKFKLFSHAFKVLLQLPTPAPHTPVSTSFPISSLPASHRRSRYHWSWQSSKRWCSSNPWIFIVGETKVQRGEVIFPRPHIALPLWPCFPFPTQLVPLVLCTRTGGVELVPWEQCGMGQMMHEAILRIKNSMLLQHTVFAANDLYIECATLLIGNSLKLGINL